LGRAKSALCGEQPGKNPPFRILNESQIWFCGMKKNLILTPGQKFRGAVGHAEAGSEMLGQKHDRGFVLVGILLSEVLHGVHQQTLAFDVTSVNIALLALTSGWIGQNRDREYFGQERTSRPVN
jgi:hypothetical protein